MAGFRVLTFDFDNTGKLTAIEAKLDELYLRSDNIVPDQAAAK